MFTDNTPRISFSKGGVLHRRFWSRSGKIDTVLVPQVCPFRQEVSGGGGTTYEGSDGLYPIETSPVYCSLQCPLLAFDGDKVCLRCGCGATYLLEKPVAKDKDEPLEKCHSEEDVTDD